MDQNQQPLFPLDIQSTKLITYTTNHTVTVHNKPQTAVLVMLYKSKPHMFAPLPFFFPLFTEMKTSTMTMTINSSTITVSAPSPAPRYTKQDVPPTVQPAGGAGEDGAVEGVAVLLLGTLGVSTGLCVMVVAETNGFTVVPTALVE